MAVWVTSSHSVLVAIGVIRRDSSVLLTQRQSNMNCPDVWEFPGGKVNQDETVQAGLIRELSEEIGIYVTRTQALVQFGHAYPYGFVRGYVWLIESFSGDPQPQEGQTMQWVDQGDLSQIDMPAANHSIVRQLCRRIDSR